MSEQQQWSDVTDDGESFTDRLKVPSGWIYRTVVCVSSGNSDGKLVPVAIAQTFVPDGDGGES